MARLATWYHAHEDAIGRAQGRTAVGVVAYITGENLTCEREDRACRRNHPGDVVAYGTVAQAGSPAWMTDNAMLEKTWNAVERAETRINSQLCRHWNVALYRDWTDAEKIEVMKAIAQRVSDRYGNIVTWAVHKPTDHGDPRNGHCHFVYNLREATPAGFGEKVRDPISFKTAKSEMMWVRGMIADEINLALERTGVDERVTHLSYKELGIGKEPTKHLGPKQHQAELKGQKTEIGEHNRDVQERNREYEAQLAKSIDAIIHKLESDIHEIDTERRKRQEEKAVDFEPADFADQQKREIDLLRNMKEQKERTADFEKRVADVVEDAKKRERENQEKIDSQRRAGDIADPQLRYLHALGRAATGDSIDTAIRAAAMEGSFFAADRQELIRQIALEQDADKRRALELRRDIEAAEYMAVTTDRIIGLNHYFVGVQRDWDEEHKRFVPHETADMKRDREASRDYWAEARDLRDERREFLQELDRQQRRDMGDQLGKLAGDISKGRNREAPEKEQTDRQREVIDDKAARIAALNERGARDASASNEIRERSSELGRGGASY